MSKLSPAVGSSDHMQGPPDGAHILVEYGDYQCPSCAQALPLIHEVQKHFGRTLTFVFRNFPLNDIHPNAEAAAETAEFAAAHGKFWEMHDLLFKNQKRLWEEDLPGYAEKLGLDPEALKQALENKTYAGRVQADLKGGIHSGVNATPSFFIQGKLYDASYDAESLIKAIEAA